MTISIDKTTIIEGETMLVVPAVDEPKMIPAFFNPKGKTVRDVSIVCYNTFSRISQKGSVTFADSLSGVGARGVRVANEVKASAKVFLNDLNPTALELARESAKLNHVEEKCSFSNLDVCSFLASRSQNGGERFDIVDIDPFGTPSDFVDCGIRAVKDGGLLSLAATDSAVLCGVYPKVSQRKYLGLPLRTDYCHEIGLRLMFGLQAMSAMRFETGIRPLFCHHDMHYFRTYSRVMVGNKFARETQSEIGFALHCFGCGYRTTVGHLELINPNLAAPELLRKCPNCKKDYALKAGGPLWIGKIQSSEFVSQCKKLSDLAVFNEEELDIPLYYDVAGLSDKLGIRTPRLSEVIVDLQASGYRVSRTHLNPNALKTDAPLQNLYSVLEKLGR